MNEKEEEMFTHIQDMCELTLASILDEGVKFNIKYITGSGIQIKISNLPANSRDYRIGYAVTWLKMKDSVLTLLNMIEQYYSVQKIIFGKAEPSYYSGENLNQIILSGNKIDNFIKEIVRRSDREVIEIFEILVDNRIK